MLVVESSVGMLCCIEVYSKRTFCVKNVDKNSRQVFFIKKISTKKFGFLFHIFYI